MAICIVNPLRRDRMIRTKEIVDCTAAETVDGRECTKEELLDMERNFNIAGISGQGGLHPQHPVAPALLHRLHRRHQCRRVDLGAVPDRSSGRHRRSGGRAGFGRPQPLRHRPGGAGRQTAQRQRLHRRQPHAGRDRRREGTGLSTDGQGQRALFDGQRRCARALEGERFTCIQ